jgi:hypothetical protein
MKKYWYKEYVDCCPVCCREDRWKERVYGEKPKAIEFRTEWTYHMCCTP